ncbi:ABC transporter ATP-binding protein [Glaciecola siphonariae]|uniref:ABC transporter ATP-binding protein n=1 Tax=Glaciecola siphonariae TaxID=521012 RepID=A0ABV9LWC8_9ALTE
MHLSFFTQYLRPYRHSFALIFILMVLESAISLAIPFFIGQFASAVLQEAAPLSLFNIELNMHYGYLVGAWLGLIVLQTLARYQVSFRVNMVGARILTNLSCRLYDHVQMLPVSYFSKRKKGEILSLISNDANVIAYFMSGILTGLVPSLLIASGALLLMASINMPLALIIAVSVPGFLIILKLMGRKIRPLSEQVTAQQAGIVSIAAENFSTIKLVKSFSREKQESDKFKQNAQQMLNLRRQQFQIQALISPLIQMLISVGIVLVVLVSALHYRAGELSIAQLITLLMYGLLFAKPMSSLAGVYGQWQQAMGASTRIIDVFKVAPETDDTGTQEFVFKKGEVELKQVSFCYENNSNRAPLLSKLNAQFKAGSVNVIIGANGSGKTTLLHLLMRFISPQSGQIFIDKQDISECGLRSLRRHIGLVSQDVALSHGSILSNIAYGQSEADFQAVSTAAKQAGAHEFISALPNAYDTQVGDNGVLLSGGQRQRISLARTLLLNCNIIIFDEPTSFADSHGKAEFAKLLSTQLQQHTVIVVTHDQALCDVADKVFTLKNGELY